MATKQSNRKAEKKVEMKAAQKGEKKAATNSMRSAPKAQARAKPEAQPTAGATAAAKPAGEAGATPVAAPSEGTNSPVQLKTPAAGKGPALGTEKVSARAKKGAKATEDAAPAAAATPAKDKGAVAAVATAPDPRLPAPGTVLQKRDRHGAVRCECTVEKEGVRYAGKVYRSLSAAAMAAAKDLGLNNKTANGFTFWGLSKPPRPEKDRLAALERVWERYRGSAESLVKREAGEEGRVNVLAAMRKHADALAHLVGKAA